MAQNKTKIKNKTPKTTENRIKSNKDETNGIYVQNTLNKIIEKNPEFQDFFTYELEPMSYHTQQTYLHSIHKFFLIIKKWKTDDLTKNDITTYLNHKKFKSLSNNTKNHYLMLLRKFFTYYKREDLIDLLPNYKEKQKELNKLDLISREDLDLILKNVNTQKKAMTMVLYEGALRRDELANIHFKDVSFNNGFVELYLQNSKTVKRNIPLIESVPYLKEYLSENDFKPEDKIFDFHTQYITTFYSRLNNKLKKKYPEWTKNLHPHLLRHSRLTELATTQLNEPQIKKFAGWTKNSTMSATYFHLDDTDIKNILVQQNGKSEYKKPKPKTFKSIVCKVCNTENPQQNAFCFKCGNVINKDRVVMDRVQEKVDIDKLKEENQKLKKQLSNLKEEMKEEMQSLFEELYYRQELSNEIKSGKLTVDEAKAEFKGISKK